MHGMKQQNGLVCILVNKNVSCDECLMHCCDCDNIHCTTLHLPTVHTPKAKYVLMRISPTDDRFQMVKHLFIKIT